MTEFLWKIQQLDCLSEQDNLTNVIVTAYWCCIGSEGTVNSIINGTCQLAQPTTEFIPYESLTEKQLLSWCWSSGLDKEATEQAIELEVQQQLNLPIVCLPLPWV